MPCIQARISTPAPARGAKQIIQVWISALIAVFAFLLLGSALAADGKKTKSPTRSSASQEERAACMSSSNQDRAACLREVGAARQAARRGGLTDPGDYRQNALRRCEVFTQPDERKACERRALGDGSMSGSVEEGGVLRQTTTVETIGTPAPGSQPSMQPGAPRAMPSGRMSGDMMQPGMMQPGTMQPGMMHSAPR